MKLLANGILLLTGLVLVMLLVYGVVGLVVLWADSNSVPITQFHRLGITALGLLSALFMVRVFMRMLFHRRRLHLSEQQLDEISDPLSVLHPVRQLLGANKPATYAETERCMEEFCSNVTVTYQSAEWRLTQVRNLNALVNKEFSDYRDHVALALLRLSTTYAWLPQPNDPFFEMLARCSHDLGALGQIVRYVMQRRPALTRIAWLLYEHQRSLGPLAQRPARDDIDSSLSIYSNSVQLKVKARSVPRPARSADACVRDFGKQIPV